MPLLKLNALFLCLGLCSGLRAADSFEFAGVPAAVLAENADVRQTITREGVKRLALNFTEA
jgi:hypothetical protein